MDIPLRHDTGLKLLQTHGSPVDSQIIHELKKMLSSNSLMSVWAAFESNQRMRSVPDLKTRSRTELSSLWFMTCSLIFLLDRLFDGVLEPFSTVGRLE